MKFLIPLYLLLFYFSPAFGQNSSNTAELLIQKVLDKVGNQKYLQIKTIVSEGNFTLFRDGTPYRTDRFLDVIVLPNQEITEFKSSGERIIQANIADKGWFADFSRNILRDQTDDEISNFKKSMRTSLYNLLMGYWKPEKAVLSYIGKRPSDIGKRNDVIKLSYPDGFEVEFEISDQNLPVKVIYKTQNKEGKEIIEYDKYAQFVEIQGILTPLIIDHYQNDVPTWRVNYINVTYNKTIPETIFQKPRNLKEIKKNLKI